MPGVIMGDVVHLNQIGILGHAVSAILTQIVLYDAKTGGIRWYNPPAERALQGLSGGLPMHLHTIMHAEEAETWLLEGQLALKSGQPLEYVEHSGYVGGHMVSSRTGAWELVDQALTKRQLVFVQVTPASTRNELAMRLMLPLDRPLRLAEEYMMSDVGTATIAGQ